MTEKPLWQPSPDRIRQSRTDAFRRFIEERHSLKLAGYDALYRWSVEAIEPFWEAVWDFCGVIGDRQGPTLIDGDKMPGAAFFPQARINWAENLLRQTGDSDAIIFQGEDKAKRRLTWRQLHDLVSRLQQALAAEGIGEGDIVAGFMPNLPETAAAAIATASLGAVWTSCSPDFGTAGVLDRFGQVAPKLLFAPDGYFYAGKTIDVRARVAEFVQQLPSVKRLVSVSYIGDGKADTALKQAKTLADFVAPFAAKPVTYRRVAFNAPLFVMYSSGTTGKPKCIVHGVGGTLLQHMKEHQLQCDVRPMDRVLYFTTCGWMMWNWQVSALASGASLLLYDGSPFHPSGEVLWDYAEREKATLFGTSAKYLDASAKAGVVPKDKFPLASVRTLCSTGSPLAPEGFDYVYDKVKSDICLSSISGGTDIIGCFVGGNPIGPVWRGQIQARHLAMAVQVFDEEGRALIEEKGELVCTKPFPSMPIYFWDDAKGERYFNAYFARFKNIWCHGDYVALTKEGGMVVFGRSDATLNPGGVRIGTAEIYRQVEQLPEVLESIVIGQNWDNDVRVVLFVKLKPGLSLDEALVKKIKTQIREGCTPRHVPAKVLQVEDIPRTKSGKVVELAVRDVVEGRAVKNKEALANPEALAHFEKRAELAS